MIIKLNCHEKSSDIYTANSKHDAKLFFLAIDYLSQKFEHINIPEH
jgi:hypothetical protein